MVSSFLVLLREGVEAALIVAIVLGYLQRKAAGKGKRFVWSGVGLAVLASLVTAAAFHWIVGGFSGRAEEIFEGALMLAACGVLIYMVIWTARAARDIKATLTDRVDTALASGQLWSLTTLVFFAVWREGVETVLFLAALPSAKGLGALVGAAAGLATAVGIAAVYLKAAEKLNLRRFFQVTAVLLILMAAGLGAHGVHELQEAGVVPIAIEHVFDINPTIHYGPGSAVDGSSEKLGELQPELAAMLGKTGTFSSKKFKPYREAVEAGLLSVSNPVALAFHERGAVGSLAKAVLGYNGNPSLVELVTYIALLISSTALFRSLSRKRPGTPTAIASQDQ